jgi:hypothetical protein
MHSFLITSTIPLLTRDIAKNIVLIVLIVTFLVKLSYNPFISALAPFIT